MHTDDNLKPIIHLTTSIMRNGEVRVNRIKFKRFEDGNLYINMKKAHSRATDKKAQMQMVLYDHEVLRLKAWLNEHYPD